ncbi:MAG: YjjG family noncanonical pyrimidine nucleotidase [Cyclobacteriaceae bacterium]
MSKYKHLLFDLDHTLWDYEQNVRESLSEIFLLHKINSLGNVNFEKFFEAFKEVNNLLWHQFNLGKIDRGELRAERFIRIFNLVKLPLEAIPESMEDDFIIRTSSKPGVIPDAFEVLKYLNERYAMHIITNGFNESQFHKLNHSGLIEYFDLVVTSENSGFRKPDKRIFQHALVKLKTSPSECLMIGDNPHSDILGAKNANIDQVHYNPSAVKYGIKPTHTIQNLKALMDFL